MANEIDGVLIDSIGRTLFIQNKGKYVYIHGNKYGELSGTDITQYDITAGTWILLAEEPLIKWSEE